MIHLVDWLTTPQIPIASKLTNTLDFYLHDHTFFEIFYLLEGSIEHTLNGEKTTLYAGDILFLNPEDVHMFLRTPDNTCRHRDIVLRKSFFKLVCNYISPDLYNDFTKNKICKRFHLTIQKMNEFEEIFGKLSVLPATKSELIMSYMRTVSAELLGLLVSSQLNTHLNYPEWFQNLLQKFNEPAYLCDGLDCILSSSFYTKEHICRVFKKFIGMTMTEYLNDRRLEIAANQLTYTNEQIIKICNDLGFSSISYFNKIFRLKYGCSPSQFRKNTLEPHINIL